MATHFCILAWRIPWIEEHSRLQFGAAESDMTEQLPLDTVDTASQDALKAERIWGLGE